jgi:Zn-dependent protease with chaperone function
MQQRCQISRKSVPITAPRYKFTTPAKGQVGTLSNASGNIVIFDSLSEFSMDEATLNFVIAREMGHVIGRHHQENTALSLIVSVGTQLLFPIANIIRGAAAVLPVTTSVTATSSAASFLGSRILQSAYRQEQLDEADAIAFKLLRQAGWNFEEIARSVDRIAPKPARIGEDGWIAEFHRSKARLDLVDCTAPWSIQPEITVAALNDVLSTYELAP